MKQQKVKWKKSYHLKHTAQSDHNKEQTQTLFIFCVWCLRIAYICVGNSTRIMDRLSIQIHVDKRGFHDGLWNEHLYSKWLVSLPSYPGW